MSFSWPFFDIVPAAQIPPLIEAFKRRYPRWRPQPVKQASTPEPGPPEEADPEVVRTMTRRPHYEKGSQGGSA